MLGRMIRSLYSLSRPPQGVTSDVIGMSLQWIMNYSNAKYVDMKCTTLLAPDVDYEFACFANIWESDKESAQCCSSAYSLVWLFVEFEIGKVCVCVLIQLVRSTVWLEFARSSLGSFKKRLFSTEIPRIPSWELNALR